METVVALVGIFIVISLVAKMLAWVGERKRRIDARLAIRRLPRTATTLRPAPENLPWEEMKPVEEPSKAKPRKWPPR